MYHKISENEKINEIKLITIYKYDTINSSKEYTV